MKTLLLSILIFSFSATADEWRTIANEALKTIGADVPGTNTQRCSQCHAMEYKEVHDWGKETMYRLGCIKWWKKKDPKKIKECLQNESGSYTPKHLGYLSAFLDQPEIIEAFKLAFEDKWEEEHNKAVENASMPPPMTGSGPIPTSEWQNLKKWVEKDMIYLDLIMGNGGDYESSCTPFIDKKALGDSISKSLSNGWTKYHKSMNTKFLGCENLSNPLKCFTQKKNKKDLFPKTNSLPHADSWKYKHHPHAKMRVITDTLPWTSDFWFRSSPDGKFVASGVYGYDYKDGNILFTGKDDIWKSIVTDLRFTTDRKHKRKQILLEPRFDPDFMPDNSAINMAGGMFCPMSLLKYGSRNYLNFQEFGCSSISEIGLYQSIGMGLDNQDSLAVSGNFASDFGGFDVEKPDERPTNPLPKWLVRSKLKIFPLEFNGHSYDLIQQQEIKIPYYGDWMLSKNAELMVARKSGWDKDANEYLNLGFGIFKLSKKKNGEYKPKKLAQFCTKGAKASFSFDDRFIVYHSYVSKEDHKEYGYAKDDKTFLEMVEKGMSDIWYIDLLEGTPRRMTLMKAGQFALFPHFRADGWLYFVVKDYNTKKVSLVASSNLIY